MTFQLLHSEFYFLSVFSTRFQNCAVVLELKGLSHEMDLA
jgi:hypothetical protein